MSPRGCCQLTLTLLAWVEFQSSVHLKQISSFDVQMLSSWKYITSLEYLHKEIIYMEFLNHNLTSYCITKNAMNWGLTFLSLSYETDYFSHVYIWLCVSIHSCVLVCKCRDKGPCLAHCGKLYDKLGVLVGGGLPPEFLTEWTLQNGLNSCG